MPDIRPSYDHRPIQQPLRGKRAMRTLRQGTKRASATPNVPTGVTMTRKATPIAAQTVSATRNRARTSSTSKFLTVDEFAKLARVGRRPLTPLCATRRCHSFGSGAQSEFRPTRWIACWLGRERFPDYAERPEIRRNVSIAAAPILRRRIQASRCGLAPARREPDLASPLCPNLPTMR